MGPTCPALFRLRVGGRPAQGLLAGTWGHRPGGPLWGTAAAAGPGPSEREPQGSRSLLSSFH